MLKYFCRKYNKNIPAALKFNLVYTFIVWYRSLGITVGNMDGDNMNVIVMKYVLGSSVTNLDTWETSSLCLTVLLRAEC